MSNKSKIFLTVVATVLILGFVVYQAVTSNTQYIGTLNTDIGAIKFVHTDENEGEDLIITSDKKVYQGFSGTTIYFSVNPLLKEAEDVALQFYFTDPNAKAVQIYQRKDNAWWALPLGAGEVTDSKFSESFTRKKEIDGKIYTQSRTFYDSTGETEYFMAELAYTPGTPGQFLIEAFGESGSYGILDPWYDSGWSYRKKITINPQYVADGLSNFPMLFSRTDLDLRATASGGHVASTTGGDILFTAADGATKLDHEIEAYTSTTGELVAWVEVPFVSSTSTRDIYIYYGNSTIPLANQQNVTGVWDASYVGVYHMNDNLATTNVKESTSNGFNGTNQANTNTKTTSGKTGSGLTYNGSTDYTTMSDQAGFTPGAGGFTVSAWLKPNSIPPASAGNRMWAVCKCDNPFEWNFTINDNDTAYGKWNFGAFTSDGGSGIAVRPTLTSAVEDSWQYVVATLANTSATPDIFFNGVSDNGTANVSGAPGVTNTSSAVSLGRKAAGGEVLFDGIEDEIRISSTVRSAAWIATEYNNQSSPNTFYSYSGEGVENQSASMPSIKVRGGVKFR